MTHDRIGMWTLLAVAVVTAAVFFWTTTHYQHGGSAADTYVDTAGRVHVLGVTLGGSTLREAEKILQSKAEVALYIYPQGHVSEGLKMEGFFPSIADHTKVVLLLDLPRAALLEIEARATRPYQAQNGVIRMNPAAADLLRLADARVAELTLIPSLNVTADNLKARFGVPDTARPIDKGTRVVYRYDSVGLSATLGEDVLPMLHFANPVRTQ